MVEIFLLLMILLPFIVVIGEILTHNSTNILIDEYKQKNNFGNKFDEEGYVTKEKPERKNFNTIFKKFLNIYKQKDVFIIELKQYKKLEEKYYKLVNLIDPKYFDILEESLTNLVDNSFKNLIIISKLKKILDVVDEDKLSKTNKKHYKINLEFYQKEKEKFKESLDLYDYIILKLIDIETKINYDYEDIKNYIDNLIKLNNHNNIDLDFLETKYLNANLDDFGVDKINNSLLKNMEKKVKNK